MKQFVLRLTNENLQTLSAALIEMPYRLAAPLIQEINDQLRQQKTEAENELPTPS